MRLSNLLSVAIVLVMLACSGGPSVQEDQTIGSNKESGPNSFTSLPKSESVTKPTTIPATSAVTNPTPIPTSSAVINPTPIPTTISISDPDSSSTTEALSEAASVAAIIPAVESTSALDSLPKYSFIAGSISVKLTNDSNGKATSFGTSVAIDKDKIIVGDPSDYSDGSDSGSAVIYELDNGTWVEQDQITADDIYQGYQFGGVVDIDGDTAVIGAIGGAKGAAYVFEFEDGIWTQQAKLIDLPTDSSAQFGNSVAISGNTIVVGAPLDDEPETNSGSVFVFTKSDEVWTKQTQLTPSGRIYTLASNRFGESVSIHDDKIYVGASGDWTTNGTDSGAVYVFGWSGGTWVEEQRLNASDGSEGDKFGKALSVFDDILVVGSPYHDGNGTDSGAAYVFVRDTQEEWYEETKLVASDGVSSDNFGWSVGVGEDLAIVGALYSDAPSSNSGSVYTYDRTGTDWIERSKLTGTESASDDKMGTSVAISGELAVAGAPGYTVDSKETGAIHVFTAEQR